MYPRNLRLIKIHSFTPMQTFSEGFSFFWQIQTVRVTLTYIWRGWKCFQSIERHLKALVCDFDHSEPNSKNFIVKKAQKSRVLLNKSIMRPFFEKLKKVVCLLFETVRLSYRSKNFVQPISRKSRSISRERRHALSHFQGGKNNFQKKKCWHDKLPLYLQLAKICSGRGSNLIT